MPHQEQTTARRSRSSIPKLEDLLYSSFSERKLEKELKICEIARRIFSFCHYRRAMNHYCYVRPAVQHMVVGARRGQSSLIVVDLAHPMRWYEEIYRKGLAQVRGLFILDSVEELDDGRQVVLACKQGTGCSLRNRFAFARQEGGTWRLDWKNIPKKYYPHANTLTSNQTVDYYRLAMMRQAARSIDSVLKGCFNPDM